MNKVKQALALAILLLIGAMVTVILYSIPVGVALCVFIGSGIVFIANRWVRLDKVIRSKQTSDNN